MKDQHVSHDEADKRPSVTTSSLLEQVRAGQPHGWGRLVRLYGPLVYSWCRRMGLQSQDAADVAQDVYRAVLGKIDEFQHGRTGAFRSWLKTITQNKVRDLWRRRSRTPLALGGSTAQLRLTRVPVAAAGSQNANRDQQEINELYRRALELVRDDFEPSTWRAFWQVVVEGRAPADVAADLGMTANAVYIAKSRVLSRIRSEFAELID